MVRDKDYQMAIQSLLTSGFVSTVPDRTPPPEVMEHLPDPQAVLADINEGYKSLDQSSTTFNYPDSHSERQEQVVLIRNSFAHIPWRRPDTVSHYVEYGNLLYPLERPLIESFVRGVISDEKDDYCSSWGELLKAWISMMVGYLDIDNDILDLCEDERAVAWYSTNFGRKYGEIDRRITKRLGSGKQVPFDMRGRTLSSD